MKGIVFDIQRAALHDGPGIRTVVFLKGCPLRCVWCHNPESQRLRPQTGRSGRIYGEEMTLEAVMEQVSADRPFYDNSGGGLTLSGGEPSLQFEFCRSLLIAAKSAGIHTCLDTCGHTPTEKLNALLPFVDLFHFDWKLDCRAEHERWTGGDYVLIQHNLQQLIEAKARIILRCPIVPGVNDTEAHEKCLSSYARHPGIEGIERLAYHTHGLRKYTDLGLEFPHFDHSDESALATDPPPHNS